MKTVISSITEVRSGQFVVSYLCDNCGCERESRKSNYDRKQRHYCSTACYSAHRKTWDKSEQPTWRGGVSPTEAHRRWKAKNPERMAHLKARRYAREKGAEGRHTLEEWEALKESANQKCLNCREEKELTKDHIIPLSKGGTDYIDNIQPLCRNCNSKKHNHIHENPELLEE